MFELDWGKLVIIGVVALIVIGPKELPGVLRMMGQWMGKMRRMATEFQGQFQEAMREAEMADLKKQVDDIKSAASDFGSSVTNYDPLATPSKSPDAPVAETADAATTTATASAAAEPPVADAPPAPDLTLPVPEPAPPVNESDFASPDPVPPKEGGERAA
jgi:sec-independent protein translocase protein TatB